MAATETGQTETTDAVAQDAAPEANEQVPMTTNVYCTRQIGLLGIVLIIGGLALIAAGVFEIMAGAGTGNSLGQGIGMIITGFGFLYIDVEDKGDYLLVTTGPCRWCLCGWGKEKVKYSEVTDFAVVKTCWYTFPESACCTGVRLLNQCSCFTMPCCGSAAMLDKGGCCAQKTVRLTVTERMYGHEAIDGDECCLEKCCLKNCFGAKCDEPCLGGTCGEGCCFSCCNPCGANCCAMNTMYISTNDPEGLVGLLKSKVPTKTI